MIQLKLPDSFVSKVHGMFGDRGRDWLPRLPGLLEQCRARWSLENPVMCSTMSMNYIEFASLPHGEPVAVKIGVPHDDLFTEMEALRLFDGNSAIRLLDADRDLGAILMQRATPGTMLWEHGDNAAQTLIAAGLMRDLSVTVPATHALPRVEDQMARAFRSTRTHLDPQERMPRDLLTAAEDAMARCLRDGGPERVLHGDLHHENILYDARRGWLAIDPKGVIGPRCLEVGRFLQNQLPAQMPLAEREQRIRDRIRIFAAELDLSSELVAAAALIDSILGHCWGLEEEVLGEDWHTGLETAPLLCELM